MTENRDPYAVLGVGRDATAQEISRAYRQQMRRHHPDTAAKQTAADRGAVVEVQAAYVLLRDGPARARYDAEHPVAPRRSRARWTGTEPLLGVGPVRWQPAR